MIARDRSLAIIMSNTLLQVLIVVILNKSVYNLYIFTYISVIFL